MEVRYFWCQDSLTDRRLDPARHDQRKRVLQSTQHYIVTSDSYTDLIGNKMTGKIQGFNTIDCEWANIFDEREEQSSELDFHTFQTFSHECV